MMRVHIAIDVPDSAWPADVLTTLQGVVNQREGITITTPTGLQFDADLVAVVRREVD